MSDSVTMSVSQVFQKNGKRYAFVSFQDGKRSAEGKIPDCRILESSGFQKEEIAQLEDYMEKNLADLKKMSAGIHPIRALMKD